MEQSRRRHGGRLPKGGAPRAQMVARAPRADAEYYVAQAAELGVPLCDWIALKLAEVTGRALPGYVLAEIEEHRRLVDSAPLNLPEPAAS